MNELTRQDAEIILQLLRLEIENSNIDLETADKIDDEAMRQEFIREHLNWQGKIKPIIEKLQQKFM